MLPEFIPAYSVAPFFGLAANLAFTILCLTVYLLSSKYRPVGYLFLFYLSLTLFFLGYTGYGFQSSESSILLWYRLMVAGVALMPIGSYWFGLEFINRPNPKAAWTITSLSLILAILCLFGRGEWLMGLPLEGFGAEGILRPRSILLRPLAYSFTLGGCFVIIGIALAGLKKLPPGRPPLIILYVVGMTSWGLGGLHDAAISLGWVSPLGQTIMWLGSLVLSCCLAVAVALSMVQLQARIIRARDVFERFVPAAYLARIAKQGLGSIKLGEASSQRVTILYSDIRGFTLLADSLSPSELVAFMNTYLERMSNLVGCHGGLIDKYIGDAVLSIFEGEGSEERAVGCGLAMLEDVAGINQPERLGGGPLRIGIGVHSGRVTLGTVGSSSRMDSTVMGLAVNLANRLEEATKDQEAEMLISDRIARNLGPEYEGRLKPVGELELRGIAKPVKAWAVGPWESCPQAEG